MKNYQAIFEEKSYLLNETDKDNLDKIMAILLELIDTSGTPAKSNLEDIKKYLSQKLKREKANDYEEISDIIKLKNMVFHQARLRNGKLPLKYQKKIAQAVWAMLPTLASFKHPRELNNFLAYLTGSELPGARELTDKYKIVEMYEQYYVSLPAEEQERRLMELAAMTFNGAERKEIKRYQYILDEK
ncbi:MAG: hypothetical protein GY862_32130 [Gammaproteobacteria bacterium]|nr:hypothetical protein [Gammaproteobacteria bacterium]